MAYYDENGTITIDEQAAEADIRRIDSAIESLENSKQTMTSLMHQAGDGSGQTATATAEKAQEMINNIRDMINRLIETKEFIRNTVKHYEQVDAQVKASIEAS